MGPKSTIVWLSVMGLFLAGFLYAQHPYASLALALVLASLCGVTASFMEHEVMDRREAMRVNIGPSATLGELRSQIETALGVGALGNQSPVYLSVKAGYRPIQGVFAARLNGETAVVIEEQE